MNSSKNSSTSTTKKTFLVTLFELISCHIILFFKRMTKIVLHYLTGSCELERICHNEKIESVRIKRIGIMNQPKN
jgi:hypothetical protein